MNEDGEIHKQLTRREFLKILGTLGSALLLKKFYDLYNNVFSDINIEAGCIANKAEFFTNVQNEELKGSYNKALIVVHPGWIAMREPETINNNPNYKEYIKNLNQTVQTAKENEELVVFLIGAVDYKSGKFIPGFEPPNADFVEVTKTDYPIPVACVRGPNDEYYYQSPRVLVDTLTKYGVKEIDFAGEIRNACVEYAENAFDKGYKTSIIENSTYPLKEK